jgi:redox-sensitive bicupin YhaK (pirin superfamily)
MWGFQLWVNLPASDKMGPPRYQDILPDRIPVVETAGGARVKVIAGRFGGAEGPVAAVATEPVYLDVALPAVGTLDCPLPPGHAAFAYVCEGALSIGSHRPLERGTLAVLGPGDMVRFAAAGAPARAILVAGRPLREPVAKYGPFVMNTQDQIRQAIADYQAGRF